MRHTILIDGPSGAGKTTFAGELAQVLGLSVVHVEDFYPGWGGLAQASRMVAEDVLDPIAPGYRRWDWQHSRPAEWVGLDPMASIIVEGVGAITPESVEAAGRVGQVFTLVVTAEHDARKQRALHREPYYAQYWEMWAKQEALHFPRMKQVDIDRVVRW